MLYANVIDAPGEPCMAAPTLTAIYSLLARWRLILSDAVGLDGVLGSPEALERPGSQTKVSEDPSDPALGHDLGLAP